MKEEKLQTWYCVFIYTILLFTIVKTQSPFETEKTEQISPTFYNSLLEIPVIPVFSQDMKPAVSKKKIRIAIVDTGVDFSHPLLYSFKAPNQNEYNTTDTHGHGTHVAGIIAYHLNQVFGYRASSLFEIASFKYNSDFFSNIDSYNAALLEAYTWSPDFVNISSSGNMSHPLEKLIMDGFRLKNVKVIVAAGNNGSALAEYPCGYIEVYCVGNLEKDFTLSPSSNYGPFLSHYALGTDILSSLPNHQLGWWSGTSQAAPLVTAALASKEFSDFSSFYFSDKVFINIKSSKKPNPLAFQKNLPYSLNPASSNSLTTTSR